MKNTRQVPLGSEGNDDSALQQFMDAMRVFIERNEKVSKRTRVDLGRSQG